MYRWRRDASTRYRGIKSGGIGGKCCRFTAKDGRRRYTLFFRWTSRRWWKLDPYRRWHGKFRVYRYRNTKESRSGERALGPSWKRGQCSREDVGHPEMQDD
jgi:hypothetical protein